MDEEKFNAKIEEFTKKLEATEEKQKTLEETNKKLSESNTALLDQVKAKDGEITNILSEKENEIKGINDKLNEISGINREYKTKERLAPIQTWFDKQKDEVKESIKNTIVEMDDINYGLFIDGKQATSAPVKEVTEEPKDKTPIPNSSVYSQEGTGEKEKKSLEEIYSVSKGFTSIDKYLKGKK